MIHNGVFSGRVVSLPKVAGCYVAKVTDFGYSTLFKDENTSVSMPRSGYWTAPEWHEREVLPTQAKKMEAYSFGMLCLWLLCYKSNDSSAGRDFEKDMKDTSTKRLQHALGLLEIVAGPSFQQKKDIRRLLSFTLAEDPTDRTSDFVEILRLLSPNR